MIINYPLNILTILNLILAGIGHAFSGLPSSLTDPWEQETNAKEEKSLTGFSLEILKCHHFVA